MDNLQAIAELVRPHIHRGTFFLPESQTTDWYVNGRAFMLTPEASILAGRIIGNLLADDVRCIGGPATAAIPVVTAVVHQSLVPRTGFYVRPEAKGYGLLNQIEGNLEPQVAIVDDTCYTGDSIVSCIQTVEEAGSVVRQVVAVFDRGDGGERIRELGYDYRYWLRIEDGEPRLPAG
jgi:orotate phosphoribosyltransferase